MLTPAAAINPNEPDEPVPVLGGGGASGKKNKKKNKSKSKLDASHLLGFSVAAADRPNAGELDFGQWEHNFLKKYKRESSTTYYSEDWKRKLLLLQRWNFYDEKRFKNVPTFQRLLHNYYYYKNINSDENGGSYQKWKDEIQATMFELWSFDSQFFRLEFAYLVNELAEFLIQLSWYFPIEYNQDPGYSFLL